MSEHNPERAHEILLDPEFANLSRRKNSLSLTLTAAILLVYFGFVALLAFAPQVLSARIGAVTLGIPVGIGVILFAWILTGIYVRWANADYDTRVVALRERFYPSDDQ